MRYDIFTVSKNQRFLEKMEVCIYVNIVITWLLPLVSLKILKRFITVFERQLYLRSLYFPIWWTIEVIKN